MVALYRHVFPIDAGETISPISAFHHAAGYRDLGIAFGGAEEGAVPIRTGDGTRGDEGDAVELDPFIAMAVRLQHRQHVMSTQDPQRLFSWLTPFPQPSS